MQSVLRSAGQASSSSAVRASHKHGFSTTAAIGRKHIGGRPSPKRVENDLIKSRADLLRKNPALGFNVRGNLDKLQGATYQHRDAKRTYDIFRKLALGRLDQLMNTTWSWKQKHEVYQSFGLESQLDFDREVRLFRVAIDKACEVAAQKNAVGRTNNPLFWSLRNAFVTADVQGLGKEVSYAFQNFLMRSRFSKNITATHRKIADFRFPYEWFPATRALQRTVHLHVGPTNSGKTYHALKALENARSGIYAGPLRLLAHEVYSRFTAKGKPCALITGEEQRIPDMEDNYFRSCTVEMTPLNLEVDVAVIDEIQMIGDQERGWAWTQAVLGVRAKEVHLCGEERSVELIQSLCDTVGDKYVVHRYQRLSPLQPMNQALGGLKNLEKGDAIVSFSRVGIHSLKVAVEKATGRRCAIVYGSLPPETRAQQAALFNNPDNDYDYIVASDAIGMGLNLEIKRVIFETTSKRDRFNYRPMTTSEIKQIGGRAGRYKTASQAIKDGADGTSDRDTAGPAAPKTGQPGYVTTMDKADLDSVHSAFSREPEQIKTAGIQPPPSVIERFSSYFPPNTPFSYILSRLRDIARVSPRFHMCSPKEMLEIADLIQEYPMSVYDRCVLLNAPVFLREPAGAQLVQAFARCISNMDGGHLLDIPEIDLNLLDTDKDKFPLGPHEYLRRLETLHKSITLYLWVSYRYSGVFSSQGLAFHVKEIVEEKIDHHLTKLDVSEEKRMQRLANIRQEVKRSELRKKKVLGKDAESASEQSHVQGDWNEEGHEEPLYNDPSELEITKNKETGTSV